MTRRARRSEEPPRRMQAYLAKLREMPAHPDAEKTITRIWRLWCGWDGRKPGRGDRVPATAESMRVVASVWPHQSVAVRRAVLTAMASADEHASAARDVLERALGDEDVSLRLGALRLFEAERPPLDEDAARAVRAKLDDPVWSVRWLAVRVLARARRASPDELATVLLATVPIARAGNVASADVRLAAFRREWLDAAQSIDPAPLALSAKIAEQRASAIV